MLLIDDVMFELSADLKKLNTFASTAQWSRGMILFFFWVHVVPALNAGGALLLIEYAKLKISTFN